MRASRRRDKKTISFSEKDRVMKICFVEMPISSQNQFQYSHWRKYQRYRHAWELSLLAGLGRCFPPAEDFRCVKIVSVRKRLLDVGNLIGGAKPIPDSLKRSGWIRDDSPKWASFEYEQRKPVGEEKVGTWVEVGESQ